MKKKKKKKNKKDQAGFMQEPRINFESVWPYIPIAVMFVLLVVYSIGFGLSSDVEGFPYNSVIVLSGFSLLTVIFIFRGTIGIVWIKFWKAAMQANDPENQLFTDLMDEEGGGGRGNSGAIDLLPFGVTFVLWLAYGILFEEYPIISAVNKAISGVFIMWVFLTQLEPVRRFNVVRQSIGSLVLCVILFFPDNDSLPTKLRWYSICFKTIFSYLLYILASVEGETSRGLSVQNLEYMNTVEGRLFHSVWVFFVPFFYVPFGLFFGAISIYRIVGSNRLRNKKESVNGKTGGVSSPMRGSSGGGGGSIRGGGGGGKTSKKPKNKQPSGMDKVLAQLDVNQLVKGVAYPLDQLGLPGTYVWDGTTFIPQRKAITHH